LKRFLKKGDVIIILSAIIIILILLIPRMTSKSDNLIAEIYENGKLTHSVKLNDIDKPYEISINGGKVRLEKNAISYIEANCKDKTCISFGKLTKAGDTASCVPNKTVIVLKGNKKSIDVITY